MVGYSYSDGFRSARAPSVRQHFAPPRDPAELSSAAKRNRRNSRRATVTRLCARSCHFMRHDSATAEFENIFSLYDFQPR